ncbi:hypothetical protein BP6252_13373 [Coleophoma cylindrospora]|uniref:1-alkyl-2-acetylglycerophosphocholine esterase n=1 Tax=Coleophoma cylindrospora TaxID=1849047 RepID=A0A3D8QB23_9HELO|nr:hypothetical protein BP6252_13373 [Coleophoma cylindrospora]
MLLIRLTAFPVFAIASVIVPPAAGLYGVSLTDLEFLDTNRTDPYTGAPVRRLPVSLIQPVNPLSECQPTQQMYMPNATAKYWEQTYEKAYGIPLNNTFSQVVLSLCEPNHKPIREQYPLILFSPGEGTSRQLYHVLCTNIAAQGYTVVTVDAPGEAGGFTTYLDGSTEYGNPNSTDQITSEIDVRVQDIDFVLSQLSTLGAHHGHYHLNTTSPIMFGHSLGGNTALSVVIDNESFIGGLNLDGAIDGAPLNHTTTKPFMIFASDMPGALQHNQSNSQGWAEAWRNLLGPKWQLQIKNSTHITFTDMPVLGSLLGLYKLPGVTQILGSINPQEGLNIQVAVLSTLAGFLAGEKEVQSVVNVATTFPEVLVVNTTNIE